MGQPLRRQMNLTSQKSSFDSFNELLENETFNKAFLKANFAFVLHNSSL
jgi:hypothetical protein